MKEEFKQFVGSHPELIKYVNDGTMSWQKFYDMFSLYGKKEEAWKDYLKSEEPIKNKNTSMQDIIDILKKVDVDTVQKNITTINKALALIGTLLTKDEVEDVYKPRPLYKKFED